jgi:hypothetical protein
VSNLTATKAQLLLMACLMKFGALPPAANPDQPTAEAALPFARGLPNINRSSTPIEFCRADGFAGSEVWSSRIQSE